MKFTLYFLAVSFTIFTFISCDDDEDMANGGDPDPTTDTNPIPDQTSTYSEHVAAIMSNNCISCHSNPPVNGAPMALETFAQVVASAKDRNLYGRMSTNSMNNIMPPSGRLADETILLVEDWIADGLKE